MSMNIPKAIIDLSGVELSPGNPIACLGNGKSSFECCCDECDYFLLCFPEFDLERNEENLDANKLYISRSCKKDEGF